MNKPQPHDEHGQLPRASWILVTRSGPQSFTSYNSSMADGKL